MIEKIKLWWNCTVFGLHQPVWDLNKRRYYCGRCKYDIEQGWR